MKYRASDKPEKRGVLGLDMPAQRDNSRDGQDEYQNSSMNVHKQ